MAPSPNENPRVFLAYIEWRKHTEDRERSAKLRAAVTGMILCALFVAAMFYWSN